MIASGKIAFRLVFSAVILMCALVLFGGRAHADETVVADTPTEPDDVAAPPEEQQQSAPPPANVEEEPQGNPPAGADGPDGPEDVEEPGPAGTQDLEDELGGDEDPPAAPYTNDNDQTAGATTSGAAEADTGNNTAESDVETGGSGQPPANSDGSTASNASGAVGTGPGNAQGTVDNSVISQTVDAQASDDAAIDILQIALIVNVGVSHANTGDNTAAALTGAGGAAGTSGSGTGTVATGDAGAVGNQTNTTVTQSAVIGSGEQSTQLATVFNIGVGVGNTGMNVSIGSVSWNGNGQTAQGVGSSGANVAAGGADALGNTSRSHIIQVAIARAQDRAVLYIDQRAIVINFGTAFANTGGNVAVGSFDSAGLTDEEVAIVQAVMSFLAPLFDGSQLTGSGAYSGSGSADILTGTAAAVGNDSDTAIAQTAIGSVDGDGVAGSSQQVTVANFGLALANTGFNLAIGNVGGLPATATQQLAQADADLARFFGLLNDTSWLHSSNPFAAFSQTVDLGGLVLTLGGDISGFEFLAGWDAAFAPGGSIGRGIRVRQITGVLNIGIAFTNTGRNTAISLVSTDTSQQSPESVMLLGSIDVLSTADALAAIQTGTAFALGNDATVVICQEFHDALACAPVPPPEQPPGPGLTPPADPGDSGQVAPAAAIAETPAPIPLAAPAVAPEPVPATPISTPTADALPVTGADETQGWVAAGLGMVGLGALLGRRRRATR